MVSSGVGSGSACYYSKRRKGSIWVSIIRDSRHDYRVKSNAQTLFPALSLRVTASEIVVVEWSGPGFFPFSFPNFFQLLCSATACSTSAFCIVRFIRFVIYMRFNKRETWNAWVNFWWSIMYAWMCILIRYLHFFAIFVYAVLYDGDDTILIDSFCWFRETCWLWCGTGQR